MHQSGPKEDIGKTPFLRLRELWPFLYRTARVEIAAADGGLQGQRFGRWPLLRSVEEEEEDLYLTLSMLLRKADHDSARQSDESVARCTQRPRRGFDASSTPQQRALPFLVSFRLASVLCSRPNLYPLTVDSLTVQHGNRP